MQRFRYGMALLVTMLVGLALVSGTTLAQEGGPPSEEEMQEMAAIAEELGLPPGTIRLTPCVPGMGEHWANPADMPLGPIYGVHEGRVVFVEIMPSQEDFANGVSWLDVLHPISGYAIDHVDFEFVDGGHEGYEINHYDIHAYFMTHEEHGQICPGAEGH